jgi:hypothetical protein
MSCTTSTAPPASRNSNSYSSRAESCCGSGSPRGSRANRQADRLHFKDLFRHAARHDLVDCEAVERWLHYRDNRNETAHDYGEDFADATLKLLPDFIVDATALADMIDRTDDA